MGDWSQCMDSFRIGLSLVCAASCWFAALSTYPTQASSPQVQRDIELFVRCRLLAEPEGRLELQ